MHLGRISKQAAYNTHMTVHTSVRHGLVLSEFKRSKAHLREANTALTSIRHHTARGRQARPVSQPVERNRCEQPHVLQLDLSLVCDV